MIFLRCISFLIGSLILTGAPFILLPDAPQRPSAVIDVLAGCAVIALLSSGFLLVAVAGNHMKRSRRTRMLGALLLGVPILGSIAVLTRDEVPEEAWMIAPLLCCATLLFVSFVYPARRSPMYRRLRARDPAATLTEA
jgi:peptidoglycan/LPS O-acetylase OafA/YrhL